MSWLPSSSEQTSYQYSHHNSANHMRAGMCRHVLLGFFKELGDSVDKLAASPYGQKIETAQRRQRSNIFGRGPVLHNKLAVDA